MARTSPADRAETMRRIRTFAEVFQYLVDVQGWPLKVEHLEDDEDLNAITFDWDPADLGIPQHRLKDLKRFQQMRPLNVNQPWGVFFLEFAGSRLPRTQIRRLLRALVHRKRASDAPSNLTWQLDDLLFIVITGSGDSVELHFVAFSGDNPANAQFRSLSWRPVQSPSRHLRRLHQELLPHLKWPDDASDTKTWRHEWRQAFKLPAGQAISDASRLVERMARTARDLRTQIGEALAAENSSGAFSDLMGEVRTQLVSDVNNDSFANMCAQTLVYGVLSSRVASPEDFGSTPIFSTVPLANPFLEAFFEQVHDQVEVQELTGDDLPQLVADLRETNVEAILDQIGSTAKGGDPVIHFYEDFLKKYDSQERLNAGAFYTPQPAVEFIVRAVDEALRTRFHLDQGIADAATWQQVAQRNSFEVPEGVDPDKRFVSMIDPATGTGTFLVEWLRRAEKSYKGDDWPAHLKNHVLASMHAFELMLAPYAIAHLKVALELHESGAGSTGMQILLTDTLDHAHSQGHLDTMARPVAQEGLRAAKLKASERFTVVVGNPPYDRQQKALGDTTKRKGGVVRHGVPGIAPLFEAIAEPMKHAGLGGQLKNAYNDYVYFWRWALWQATELPPGPGVVSFITASSYLEGISMGGLRHLLRQAFDELWIIDLGGEGRGALKDDNIFDIQTAVAIGVGVRTGSTPRSRRPPGCVVWYRRITGTRTEKLDSLHNLKLADVYDKVPGAGLDRLVPLSSSDYFDWPKITDLFPWMHSGSQVKRSWPIAEDESVLMRRWKKLLKAQPAQREALLKKTRDRTVSTDPPALLTPDATLAPLETLTRNDQPEGVEPYGFRSFDRQWILADHRLCDFPRPVLWQARGHRQVYLTTLTSTRLGNGPVLTATPYVPDLHHFRGSYGAKDVIPLYRDASAAATPNVTQGLLAALSRTFGVDVSAEDLLAYVYALGATPAFSDRFGKRLAEAASAVHIPITAEPALYIEALALGRKLLCWHTWGERFSPNNDEEVPRGSAEELRPVVGMPNTFGYDPTTQTLTVGTGAFAPVAPELWNFEVSGLQVLDSWLGFRMQDRRGKKSSDLDDTRPHRWGQTTELMLVLAIIEHTVAATPQAADLLERIVNGPLINTEALPVPTPAERKAPKELGALVKA